MPDQVQELVQEPLAASIRVTNAAIGRSDAPDDPEVTAAHVEAFDRRTAELLARLGLGEVGTG